MGVAVKRSGFSLVEALVALAVASMCLLALFGLQVQLTRAQRRYEAALARSEARRDILALVRDLNPAETPDGRAAVPPDGTLRWTSTPLTAARQGLDAAGAPAAYAVRLYRVDATLTTADGRVRDSLSVDLMGWRRGTGPQAATGSPRPPSAP